MEGVGVMLGMTLSEMQERIADFCKKHHLNSSPEHRALDAVSELGEVAKEILRMTDYGRKPFAYRAEVKSELGDLLFSLVALANSLHVNLDEALAMVLRKYEQRLLKGSAGSEVEELKKKK